MLKKYVLKAGVGFGDHKLGAFDKALIDANVANYNLIKVSSILPPNCSKKNIIDLDKGSLLPSAYASIFSKEKDDVISAAVAVAIPKDENINGVIMEHSAHSSKDETEKLVRSFVVQAMKNRSIEIKKVLSISIECQVKTSDIYCAFATVSLW